ncbi:NADH dehydrogenase [ubiquinone] iron-sulfur protein 5-B [Tetrabaena socialis]|uniref:NADH dehydrogenase [ubiquinone] iron-sulfur protein 5 n=1 Tax=Tetrabaena socialis TaxID=47790 RepID=A0A2J7ZQ97_9CHLO|nr:NADH dehydrogenase [ubiquinone] iron-sulfur protein 5-B [Tetrabaena socialis]|eukprot:PNH02432.1 NADH dehydrogenase [ubiquinone] iron-sulfur protein 5-B [Tetrabaena socialis]
MAGMGLSTRTARCYDWYMDYLKCMDEGTAPMISLRREQCMVSLEDYNECLHREKERTRRQVVERERQAQLEGASKGHH